MNLSTIQTAIYNWANGFLNADSEVATIYWGEPNAPRPDNPSVRLKLIGGPGMVGHDELRDVAGDPNAFRLIGPRTLTLSVTAYGDEALQIISDLQTSLGNPEWTATLTAANVSVLGAVSPRDLSTPLDTKIEQRFQMDVNLLTTEDATSAPGVIEAVEATSTVGGRNGSISADNGGD